MKTLAPAQVVFGYRTVLSLLAGYLACGQVAAATPAAPKPPQPENLARRAVASADSEYSADYLARFAIDGKKGVPGSQDDLTRSWCVQGNTHRNHSEFSLAWTQSVTVAEVVCYGRTTWFAEECWKDYELCLAGSTNPVARGQFQMGDGPQRIKLPVPAQTKGLTLRFLSSYGGPNPGATEIEVFAESPPERALAKFRKLSPGRPDGLFAAEIEENAELCAKLTAGALGFNKLLLSQRHELNPTHVYTYHVEGFQAGGGLWVYDVKPGPHQMQRIVSAEQGEILDCDLAYDASEVLFSWRRARNEGYHVFIVNIDGTNLRQLTDGPQHDYNACWLPDGGIAFLSTRSSRFAYCWISPVGILHRMDRNGANIRQLSANIVNDFTPSVMADGRLIYSRWEYVDKPAIPVQSLWTIHPDGTALAGFYGNRVLSPATFMEARSIPGSRLVLCTLTSHNGPARGAIGLIDIARGNNAQAAIRNLTPEVNIGKVEQGDGNSIRGPYESPYPLDQEFFIVSKGGTVVVRNYEGTRQAKVIGPQDGLGFYCPQPVRARQRPPVLASPEGFADGDSSSLDSTGSPAGDRPAAGAGGWATVMLQDIYRGLEPQVKRGEIVEVCVVEEMRKAVRTDVANRAFGFQFPVISCGATYAGKKVWGYATVAADGSACFKVPAGVPIYFMALDAQGRALQRMRTFTHLMPGETQGCVGCHEPRRQTSAFARSAPRQPDRLRPPEWGEGIGFDYATMVQPVLDRHCVECHSGPTPPAQVDLSGDKTDFFNTSYEVLARGRKRSGEAEWDSPYVNWIPTFNGMEQNILEVTPKAWGSPRSRLADLVLNGHPDAKGQPRLKMESREIRRILAWIDLNVPYYGTSETAYPEMVGCRRMYPADLDKTLADVAARRCSECHAKGNLPRPIWTRVTAPEKNGFLVAPLAKAAGGSERCGKVVFATTEDPDYQAILATFTPVRKMLATRPRMDMPGAKAAAVDRSCLGKLD